MYSFYDWVFLVGAVSAAIAALLALLWVGVREIKRTGRLPEELRGGQGGMGWFGSAWVLWVVFGHRIPLDRLLGYVIVPGIDTGLFIGFVALAGVALSHAFQAEWHWRTGLWITYMLILPALSAAYVVEDVIALKSIPWAWIPAGLIALLLAPFAARLAYVDLYLNRLAQRPSEPPMRDFRLWRPGEPR